MDGYLYEWLRRVEVKLDRLQQSINTLTVKVNTMATTLDQEITDLTAKVAAVKTVEDSAVVLINGIPALIAAAVAQAQAAGATPAQLQALTDLGTALNANAAPLAAAVAANTPVGP